MRDTGSLASFEWWKSCHGFQVVELLVIADVEPGGVPNGLKVPGVEAARTQGIVYEVALALACQHRLVNALERPSPRYLAAKPGDELVLWCCKIVVSVGSVLRS